MTIQVKRFNDAARATAFLEKLAASNPNCVFRGHASEKQKLRTTLDRYWSIPHTDDDPTLRVRILSFRAGLIRNGLPAIDSSDAMDWLEYARHHGLPAPLLDFSWSPYVSLFFAFNRIKKPLPTNGRKSYSVIYALDLGVLARHWAARVASGDGVAKAYHEFLTPTRLFDNWDFPGNSLQFIPQPSKFTRRMHAQQGSFLYSTLDYKSLGVADLEDYLGTRLDDESSPVLTKVLIDHGCAGDVFTRLELMNVTGAALMQSVDGVADDVANTYNYNARTPYLREPTLPDRDSDILRPIYMRWLEAYERTCSSLGTVAMIKAMIVSAATVEKEVIPGADPFYEQTGEENRRNAQELAAARTSVLAVDDNKERRATVDSLTNDLLGSGRVLMPAEGESGFTFRKLIEVWNRVSSLSEKQRAFRDSLARDRVLIG